MKAFNLFDSDARFQKSKIVIGILAKMKSKTPFAMVVSDGEVSGMIVKRAEPQRYGQLVYDRKERFISYWHQIREITLLEPETTLEIGVGSRFVSGYLRDRGYHIMTLDIEKTLHPDVNGSVVELPFADRSFDVVVCYEVLEHMPYSYFQRSLNEIFRVSKCSAVLSLPDANRVYRIHLDLPFIGEWRRLFSLSMLKKNISNLDDLHFWEIAETGIPLTKIIKDIADVRFKIVRTYRIFEMPYHRFFILKK